MLHDRRAESCSENQMCCPDVGNVHTGLSKTWLTGAHIFSDSPFEPVFKGGRGTFTYILKIIGTCLCKEPQSDSKTFSLNEPGIEVTKTNFEWF